jgi:Trk K+ transport system NAD-binding subunit
MTLFTRSTCPRGTGARIERWQLAEARWPAGSVVVSIQRGSHLIFPERDTVLEPGDVVSTLTRPRVTEELRTRLRGPALAQGEEEAPLGPDMI